MDVVKATQCTSANQSVCFSSSSANQPERYAAHELPHPNHCGLKACSATCCLAQINTTMRQNLGLDTAPLSTPSNNTSEKKHPSGFLGNVGAFFNNLINDVKIIFGLKKPSRR